MVHGSSALGIACFRIGSGLEQHREGDGIPLRRLVQRRPAIVAACVQIRPGLHQLASYGRVPVARGGPEQRSAARVVARIHVRSGFDQDGYHSGVDVPLRVSARFQQNRDDPRVGVHRNRSQARVQTGPWRVGGCAQGRVAAQVASFHVRAGREECVDELQCHIQTPQRAMQRSRTARRSRIGICPGLEEQHHGLVALLPRCVVQRGHALAVTRVDVDTRVQQPSHDVGLACGRGQVEWSAFPLPTAPSRLVAEVRRRAGRTARCSSVRN